MSTTSYYEDTVNGQAIYRCLQCKYDTFSQESADAHGKCSHPLLVLPETDLPLDIWLQSRRDDLPENTRIAICLLTWNTKDASLAAALAIKDEIIRLDTLGVDGKLFWADNGSTDGTLEAIEDALDSDGFGFEVAALHTNMGQSHARNLIIERALAWGCDYLMMVDGDVEIIPYSAFSMVRYLRSAPPEVGCIGLHCHNSTHIEDGSASTECRCITPELVSDDPTIAWTNYGMFRADVVECVKFDASDAFLGPGWGFEDDDFCMQMAVKGWKCMNTKYFRHMHRRRHSSVRELGVNLAAKSHSARKAYLLEKWRGVEEVAHHLNLLANQTAPVVEY